jgi:hypothetical protein
VIAEQISDHELISTQLDTPGALPAPLGRPPAPTACVPSAPEGVLSLLRSLRSLYSDTHLHLPVRSPRHATSALLNGLSATTQARPVGPPGDGNQGHTAPQDTRPSARSSGRAHGASRREGD